MTPRTILACRVAFVGLVVYVTLPALVIAPIENDELRIALGALRHLSSGVRDMDYRYDAQAGTYVLVEALARWLAVSTHDALAAVSAVSTIVFLFSGGLVVARAGRVDWSLGGLSLLLLPESYSIGYYGSSTAPSVAAAWVGLALLGSRFRGRAGALGLTLALAAWLRLDAVLLLPSAVWLARRDGIRGLGAFGTAWVLTFAALSARTGGSPFVAIGEYGRHAATSIAPRTIALQLAASVSLAGGLLILAGLAGLVKNAKVERDALGLALTALPTLFAYGPALTSPKYLVGALPLLAILIVRGGWGCVGNRLLRAVFVGLFVLQYFAPIPFGGSGASTKVRTGDGPRPVTRLAFAPVEWVSEKRRIRAEDLITLEKLLRGARSSGGRVVVAGLRSVELVPYLYLASGFLLTSSASLADHQELRFKPDSSAIRGRAERSSAVTVLVFADEAAGLREYERGGAGMFIADGFRGEY
ncbi:MAG: hypothetical protein HYV07_22050 [Deltaproteobacteria bacterium]|nr:hypothetical protein [Deltaproteobacteria bacterium]